MTYADLENKPNNMEGGQLMTFQPSIPKPPDYIAKDAIYSVLQTLEEEGLDINNVHNTLIQERIKKLYSFEENPKTISAYKSQFKKANQFRPQSSTTSEEDIAKFIRISRKLEPILSKSFVELGYDKEALKSIVNATIDALLDELLDGV